MKNILNYLLLLLSLFAYSQKTLDYKYTYQASHYFESIDLFKDGTFSYYNKTEFLKTEINGNWQLRNDTILVLDSRPQKSQIIVFPSRKNGKRTTFSVRNMEGKKMNYYLYLITEKKDTIELKDQFDKTVIKGNFSSFYIIDSKGLHSPIYEIKATEANFFDVFVQKQRVFENEYWKYYDEYIVPLGIDKKYSEYKLLREEIR